MPSYGAPSIFDVHMEEGEGQAQVDACGRGGELGATWTSTQKIRAHWRHPVFFSCKDVGFFGQEFRLWTGMKSINFSSI